MRDPRRRWTSKKKHPPVSPGAIDREIESGVDHMLHDDTDVVSAVGHTKEAEPVDSVSGKNAELANENERLRAELAQLSLARENRKLRAEIARLKDEGIADGKKPRVRTQSKLALLLDSCTMCRFPPAGYDTRDDVTSFHSMVRDEFVPIREVPREFVPIREVSREAPREAPPCDDTPIGPVNEVHFSAGGPERGYSRSKPERESRGRSRSRERGRLAKYIGRARSKERGPIEYSTGQQGLIALPDRADSWELEREIKREQSFEGQTSTYRENGPKDTLSRRGRSRSRTNLRLNSCGRSRSRTRYDADESPSRGRSRSKTRFSDAKRSISRSRRKKKSVKSDKSGKSGIFSAQTVKRDNKLNALGRIDKIAARMDKANSEEGIVSC